MKYIIFLLVLLGASPSWGGMAAKRMLLLTGFQSVGSYGFESGTLTPWVASGLGSDWEITGAYYHSGSYYSVATGVVNGTLTLTRTTNAGNFTFWYYSNTSTTARVTIDGAGINLSPYSTWTQYSIAIAAGTHTFEIKNVSGATYVDDIVTP